MGKLKVISNLNQDPNFWNNITLALSLERDIRLLPSGNFVLDRVLAQGDITIVVTSEHTPHMDQLHHSVRLWDGVRRTITTGCSNVHNQLTHVEYSKIIENVTKEVLASLSFAVNESLRPQNLPNPLSFSSQEAYLEEMAHREYESFIFRINLLNQFKKLKTPMISAMDYLLDFEGFKAQFFNKKSDQRSQILSLKETYENEYITLQSMQSEIDKRKDLFIALLKSIESLPAGTEEFISASILIIEAGELLRDYILVLKNEVDQATRGYLNIDNFLLETNKILEETELACANAMSTEQEQPGLPTEQTQTSAPVGTSSSTMPSINPFSLFTPNTRIPISIVLGEENSLNVNQPTQEQAIAVNVPEQAATTQSTTEPAAYPSVSSSNHITEEAPVNYNDLFDILNNHEDFILDVAPNIGP